MKRLALWLLCFGCALGLRAQSPDAEFLQIYSLIQEGDSLAAAGDSAAATERFLAARRDLEAFSKAHPRWNEKIIRFRLDYLAEKTGGSQLGPGTKSNPSPAAGDRSRRPDNHPVAPPVSVPVDGAGNASALALELATVRARAEDAETRAATYQSRLDAVQRRTDETAARLSDANDRAAQIALELRESRDRIEVLEASHANLERTRDRLDRERGTLEARLKEALRPQAAAVDPVELTKAEERILLLVKENEILKAGLDHQMAENKRILETARRAIELEQQLEASRSDLAVARKQTDELRADRAKLQARLDSIQRKSDDPAAVALRNEVESLRRELAAARGSATNAAAKDTRELADMRQELGEQRVAAEKLRRENDTLLREIEKLTNIRVTPASLKVAEVAPLESAVPESVRVRRLEREREELIRELDSTRAELRRRDHEKESVRTAPGSENAAREFAREVDRLQARLGALEAKPLPYTPEELALFQAPPQRNALPAAGAPSSGESVEAPSKPLLVAQAVPAAATNALPAGSGSSTAPAAVQTPATNSPAGVTPSGGGDATGTKRASAAPAGTRRRTAKDLPPGASPMAARAERAFAARRLDEAERLYREILALDENNVFTLGNLAAIVVELGRLEEGDALLKRALAVDSQDPFSLSLLGIIRFRQQRYDDAFDALSQSAKLDPENSETQNYLGITLSQRGQRGPAEAALRKALKLNPSSPAAHYNLAVVYATQKPPFLELARYHYEKSRRVGQPANPAFEKVLRGESPP